MKCPHCNVALTIADRQGVEIDYCPQCRGVWLDRGELDKLVERAARFRDDDDYDDDDDRRRARPDYGDRRLPPVPGQAGYGPGGYGHPPHHDDRRYQKRKSFWSELFD